MKKIVMIGIVILSLMGCDGFSPDIQNNPLIQPDFEYEIDTWGSNSEIYEFTPKSNPNYTCVMFALDNLNAMGLQCFPKEKMEVKNENN